jgi:hypothetical protein
MQILGANEYVYNQFIDEWLLSTLTIRKDMNV